MIRRHGLLVLRRINSDNCTLTAPSILFQTDVTGNITLGGYLGVIWNLLQNRLNFTSKFVKPLNKKFGSQMANGSWNGIVKMVMDADVEFGVSEFTLLTTRLDVVDYLTPLITSSIQIFIRKPDTFRSEWISFLVPFALTLWIGILASIVLLSLVLTGVYRAGRLFGSEDQKDAPLFLLGDSIFHVFAIFCQQGPDVSPRSSSARTMYILAGVSSIIVLAAYSAALTSVLTVQKPELPFDTLEAFIADGTYQLETVASSSAIDLFVNSSDPLLNLLGQMLGEDFESMPESAELGLSHICQRNKYAFCATHSIADTFQSPCVLIPFGEKLGIDVISIIVTKKNPYRRLFNHNVHSLRASGALQRLHNLAWPTQLSKIEKQLPSVTLKQVYLIITVIAIGLTLGTAILVGECLFHRYSRKKNGKKKKVAEN